MQASCDELVRQLFGSIMNIISAYFGRYNLQVATMLRCNEHVDRVTQELNEAKDESEVEQQRCALYFNSGLTRFQTATLTSSCSLLGWSSFSVPSRSYGSNLQNSHQPFMFNCWTKPKYFPITVEQDRVERSFEAIEQSILSNKMARWSCEACCRSVAEWCSWFWLQEPFSSWFNWLCLSQSAGSFLGNEHKKR